MSKIYQAERKTKRGIIDMGFFKPKQKSKNEPKSSHNVEELTGQAATADGTVKEEHKSDKTESIVSDKNQPGVFYIFFAAGQNIFGMASGGISLGLKNDNISVDNLMKAYPSANQMEIIFINNEQWTHPEVGLLLQGEDVDVKPYIEAIKLHLTTDMNCSSKQVDKAISLFELHNIGVINSFDGVLSFGIPVENE